MSGFRTLARDYDGFIVDLWGVVHDGMKLFPGVLDCLARLRAADKPVVFLSNAPRRPAAIVATLAAMGLTDTFYTGIMSSGEAVHILLRDRTDEATALGRKLYHLGPPRDRDVFGSLDYIEVIDPSDADFILNTGPDDISGPEDPGVYWPVLESGLRHNIPMLCANPDLEVRREGKRIICAGLLAELYKAKGGVVIQRGKPDPAIYEPTMAILGTKRERTMAVGDSLRTDIAGAKGAGIDSCWVLSGIHALHPDHAVVEARSQGLEPQAILSEFKW